MHELIQLPISSVAQPVEIQKLSEDAKIDLQMIHECLQLCIEESERKKTIIKDIARSSSEQPGRELLSLHVNSSEESAWMQIPLASQSSVAHR